jgi:hypothetical protein
VSDLDEQVAAIVGRHRERLEARIALRRQELETDDTEHQEIYMPIRANAARVQARIIAAYQEAGHAYVGEAAWDYVKDYSGYDLRAALRAQIQ